jgi:hypothetical protein
MMTFEISDEQESKFKAWYAKIPRKKKYVGAIGGDYSFEFAPTGLGDIVKVKHVTGKELDLTEYDKW